MKLNLSVAVAFCAVLITGTLTIGMSAGVEVVLPEPTGTCGVGTCNIELCDPERKMLRDDTPKRWMVTAYYPADAAHKGKTGTYMPETLEDGWADGVRVRAHGVPEVPVLPPARGKYPVVIAMPGRGGERQGETILYEELASHGYIVLAMDQPYVANYVRFKDGSCIVPTFNDLWHVPRDRDYRYRYDDEVIEGAIGDITFLRRRMEALPTVGTFCDTSRIILAGHSLGGNVAHIYGFNNRRIKAVLDIDSKITERPVYGRIGIPANPSGKPVLFIRGMLQYQDDVGDQLLNCKNATLWQPQVQHSAFGDTAWLCAKVNRFGQWWFLRALFNRVFKCGPYWSNIDTSLGGMDADMWVAQYRAKVLEWLNKVTAGMKALEKSA